MEKLAGKTGAIVFLVSASVSASDLSQVAPLSDRQWNSVHAQVDLLDTVAYFPSLLPVIMKHRDAIGLSYQQTKAFRLWRKKNYSQMVDLMNEIIQGRLELSRESLSTRTTNEQILSKQQELFALQERLLRIRLSCRQIITSTFSKEQWSNLAFVLEEYPELAGLLEP